MKVSKSSKQLLNPVKKAGGVIAEHMLRYQYFPFYLFRFPPFSLLNLTTILTKQISKVLTSVIRPNSMVISIENVIKNACFVGCFDPPAKKLFCLFCAKTNKKENG